VPQFTPLGDEVTVPLPAPDFLTPSVKVVVATELNVAVTLRALIIETVQVPVPEQSPLQPPNADPASGAAVRVTTPPDA
jgi:hypothetical protein